MAPTCLPIRIKRTPGGYHIEFGDGGTFLYLYATTDERVGRSAPTFQEAEAFAKEVARTLTEAWSKSGPVTCPRG